ncbi:hypothetical protein DV737_g4946, partial [Chaetothyriales sp. CBS 132003]
MDAVAAAGRARAATPFRLDEGFSEDTSGHEEAPRMAALQEYVGSLSEESRMEVAFEILQTLRAANIATVVERLAPYLHLDPMVKLPPEITAQIFEHLDAATLLTASLASHTWRNRILDTELWKKLYANQGWGADARQLHTYHESQERWKGKQRAAEENGDGDLDMPDAGGGDATARPRPTIVDARGHDRLNWAFLYKQRQRLELNWTKGRFVNFQLPDPAFAHEAHTECVYTIHFVGKWLVSGSRDKTLRIWDLETRRLARRPLTGHTQSVLCLQFDPSPEEDVIISGSTDTNVIIWRFSTGQKLHEIANAHSESVLNLRFDHRYLVTCSKDKKIKVWNRRPLSPLSPDCPRIRRSTEAVRVADHIVDWASQEPSALEAKLANGTIRAMPAYQLLMTFVGHGAAINAIQIADDMVVSASGDRLIKIWKVKTGQMIRSLPGHQKGIACVQFDSKRIVSGSSDNTVRIFDPVTGAQVAELKGHSNLVRTVQAGFGDLPGSDEEDLINARAADRKHAADLREGRIPVTANTALHHLRQDTSSSRISFGARLPPGGGGSKWGKIVSGSYDESIIIWRKNVAGDWVVGLKLQQGQAMREAHRPGSLRPQATLPAPAPAAPLTHTASATPLTHTASAAPLTHTASAAPLIHTALTHNPNLTTVGVAGPAIANASISVQAAVNAAVSTGVATFGAGLGSIVGAARNRETSNPQPSTSSAAQSRQSSATASSAAHVNNPAAAATQQQDESQAQFDARRIVCCSQDSSIVGWDFANADPEIEEACKFFTGPNGKDLQHERALELLTRIDASLKIVIPGNHDITLDRGYYADNPRLHAAYAKYSPEKLDEIEGLYTGERAKAAGIEYMVEGTRTFDLPNGARFTLYASAYQPEFYFWAFGYPRHVDRYNPDSGDAVNPVADTTADATASIDIMLTHGPPLGILDRTFRGEDVGCEHLRRAVERVKPRMHCFGHIHEAWGAVTKAWSGADEYDKHDEGDKDNKHDEGDKDNKHDEGDKDNKHDEHDKYNKHDEHYHQPDAEESVRQMGAYIDATALCAGRETLKDFAYPLDPPEENPIDYAEKSPDYVVDDDDSSSSSSVYAMLRLRFPIPSREHGSEFVTVSVGGAKKGSMIPKQSFAVHKKLLIRASEYFSKLLQENFAEGRTNHVDLGSACPTAFEVLYQTLYTGQGNGKGNGSGENENALTMIPEVDVWLPTFNLGHYAMIPEDVLWLRTFNLAHYTMFQQLLSVAYERIRELFNSRRPHVPSQLFIRELFNRDDEDDQRTISLSSTHLHTFVVQHTAYWIYTDGQVDSKKWKKTLVQDDSFAAAVACRLAELHSHQYNAGADCV